MFSFVERTLPKPVKAALRSVLSDMGVEPLDGLFEIMPALGGIEAAVGSAVVDDHPAVDAKLAEGGEHLFGLLQGTAEVVLVLYEQGGGWCTCWRT